MSSPRHPLLRSALVLGLFLAFGGFSDLSLSQAASNDIPAALKVPVQDRATTALDLPGKGPNGSLAFFASAPIAADPNIRTAVIVVHGATRDAKSAFAAEVGAAPAHGGLSRGLVLIVAPQFLNQFDVAPGQAPNAFLVWNTLDWIGGDEATNAPITSYQAMDRLIENFIDKRAFPALKRIVVIGHSAGGQYVQRYALVGNAPAQLAQAGITLRFVLANPSSVAYLSAARPGGAPEAAMKSACPSYNTWRYGLEGLPAHVSNRSPAELVKTYLRQDITYVLGSADHDPAHPFLDRSCQAQLQGTSRLERGEKFFQMLQEHFGAPARQRMCLVPGVGHEELKMLQSDCAVAAVFGRR